LFPAFRIKRDFTNISSSQYFQFAQNAAVLRTMIGLPEYSQRETAKVRGDRSLQSPVLSDSYAHKFTAVYVILWLPCWPWKTFYYSHDAYLYSKRHARLFLVYSRTRFLCGPQVQRNAPVLISAIECYATTRSVEADIDAKASQHFPD
jgi:hypothetical protein